MDGRYGVRRCRMAKLISELTPQEYYDLTELQSLETLLTKNVHVLRLNLPSKENLIKEIRKEIRKIAGG